jgi:hypothetical protein
VADIQSEITCSALKTYKYPSLISDFIFNYETWFPPVQNATTHRCYLKIKCEGKFVLNFVENIEVQDGIVCHCNFPSCTALEQ